MDGPAAARPEEGHGRGAGAAAAMWPPAASTGSRQTWAWLLVLLLFVTLGVHVWPHLLPWRAQTLHRDLPYLGLALVLLGLVGTGRALLPWREGTLGSRGSWPALIGLAAVAVLIALPTVLALSQAGLTIRTGPQWGVPGTPASSNQARHLDFGRGSGSPWDGDSFFAAVSGWVYVPVEGTYHVTLDADADALVELDGRAVVGRGAPPDVRPPGVTDPATGVRRGRVDLETGFHAIRVLSRHEAGSARLRVRWILPWRPTAVTIPAEHLLPGDATPGQRQIRSAALAARRLGIGVLAWLGLGILAAGLTALRERIVTGGAAYLDRAGHAVLGLLFLMLTGIPLLLWSEQAPLLAPLFLGVAGVGALAIGGLALAARRWRPHRGPAVRRRCAWADRARRVGPGLVLLIAQAVLSARFLTFVDGRLPMPGDHSSFLYRYHALVHTLPRLRFYDPWWNAGAVDPSPALSGASAVLALGWPLLAVWRLPEAYAGFMLLVGVILAPWSLYATVRLLGGSRLAALVAGVLALAPSDFHFWWFMAHGTLPATVSAALGPLAIALAWRVFARHDHRPILVLALAAVLALGLFWVLFVLMIGPALVVGTVILWRRLRRRDWALAAGVTAAVLLVHSHWLLGLLGFPELPQFVRTVEPKPTLRGYVVDVLLPIVVDPNPIVLVLGGVGTFLLPRPLRAVYGAFVLSLLATATVVHPVALLHPVFGRLELDRFLVPFGFALIPPAAWTAARLLRAAGRGFSRTFSPLVAMGVLAVLFVHLDGVWRQYSGQVRRTARQVEFMSEPTRELVEWIRTSAMPDGRILLWGDLPGPSRLEGGYKAYLQPLTDRPLMGYHMNAKVVDLRVGVVFSAPDIRAALEAFNVRHVIVGDDERARRTQLDGAPGLRFRQALSRFVVYDVDIRPSYLLGARGHVTFDYDRLDVRLDDPVDEVTLKFRWTPGLVSDPPVSLGPVEILPGVRFIRVRTAGTRAFRVRYAYCCPWHPAEMLARWRSGGG